MVEAALLNQGWHLSRDGIEKCKNDTSDARVESIVRKALDIDLRHVGLAALPADIIKGKIDKIQGPMVLQIQKVRNVSAPKANEDSGAAPPLLRLQLTDGHTTLMALVLSNITKISLSTPPGSKLKITGPVTYNHCFLLLTSGNCSWLGGHVDELVHRWELAKSLYLHTRSAVRGSGGPPPWVPFSQRSRLADASQKPAKITMKKSLEDPKPKEPSDQDKEFAEQRKAAIQEVNKSKPGQGKTFGGTKTPAASQMKEGNREQGRRDFREPGRRGFENDRRDGGMRNPRRGEEGDGQMAAAKSRSNGIYRDLDYGGYQPSDKDIQQLVSMGFKRDAASNALRKHAGKADAAVEMLLAESGPSQEPPQASGRPRQDTRPERSHGNMRRGRRGDDEEEASAPPAAPATLFDFLQPKLGKDKEKGAQPSTEAAASSNPGRTRNYNQEQPSSVREAGINFVHAGDKGQSSNYRQSSAQQGHYQGQDGSSGRNARHFDQKPGAERSHYNAARNYAGNEGRVGGQDRGHGGKENSHHRDWNPTRERRDNNRQGNDYPPRRDNARGEDRPRNDNRGSYDDRRFQSDGGSARQERSERTSERKSDFRPGDFKDNRPPRFQKQSDSQSENASLPRRDQRDERPKMSRDGDGNQLAGNQSAQRPQSGNQFAGASAGPIQKQSDSRSENANLPRRDQRDERPKMSRDGDGNQLAGNQSAQRPQSGNQFAGASAGPIQKQSDSRSENANLPRRDQRDERPKMSRDGDGNQLGGNQSAQRPQSGNQFAGASAGPIQKQSDSRSENVSLARRDQRDERPKMSRDGDGNQLGGNQLAQQPQSGNQFAGASAGPMQPFPSLKPGDQCQAKYWEDKQYYNAVLTAIHPSGKTCVVLFPDYGNHEEVKMADIRLLPSQALVNPSQAPPGSAPTLLMSGKGGLFEGSMDTHLEFRQGGEGTAYNRPKQQHRDPARNARPSQRIYQPPSSRN